MRPKVASSRRQRPDEVAGRSVAREREPPRHLLFQDRKPTRWRIRFLQALGHVARRGAEEIARIDQPVADLVERKAEQATRAERRQHDLRAFLGAVGFRHRVSALKPV